MARTAEQMPGHLSLFDLGALAHIAAPALGAHGAVGGRWPDGDDLTARAVAWSGLAALFGLPVLMLASIMLSAPFAAPAAIALGYLGTSYALASEHPRSAAAINAVVLVGLVVWSFSFPLAGEGLSKAGLAAVLLAPCFAAAPAVARLVITPRRDAASSVAQRNAACLDQLAPSEAVLVVRPDGTLLAATRAAEASLGRLGDFISGDVGRCFGVVDRPKLLEAITRCRAGDAPIEITLEAAGDAGGMAQVRSAEISATEGGTVSVRLTASAGASARDAVELEAEPLACAVEAEVGPVVDVADAVAFAAQHAQASHEAKQVALTSEVEGCIAVRCERQSLRRILVLMIESALAQAGSDDALHLSARALRGVALIQLAWVPQSGDARHQGETDASDGLAALRQLVDEAGGTLLADTAAGKRRLSVRLNLAASALAK